MAPTRRSAFLHMLLLYSACIALATHLIRGPQIASSSTATTNESVQIITADSSVQRELTRNERHQFKIFVVHNRLLRFSIDKGDLGLSTAVYGPAGDKLLEKVSLDFELVDISVPVQTTGEYIIELRSLERSQARREYELRVRSIASVTTAAQKSFAAQQAVAHADALGTMWQEAGLRLAVEEYDRAASLSGYILDPARASQSMLKSGNVNFLLSEYTESLKRYQRGLALADKARDWLSKARALSQMGRLQSYLGNNRLAQKNLTSALEVFKDHQLNQDPVAVNAYGEALSNMAELSYAKGDFLSSAKQLENALKVLQNDRRGQAKIRLFMGYIAGSTGNPDSAVSEISQSLDLYREINDRVGEGLTLTALGLAHSLKRDENHAIELHRQALNIFHSIGDRHSEAVTLNALGHAYENLSEFSIALTHYSNALRLFQTNGLVDGASLTTCNLARAVHLSGNSDQALTYYDDCLRLSRAAGKLRTEAYALNEIAKVYIFQHRLDLASKQFQRIQKFYEGIGDLRGQAKALNAYGDFLFQTGQKEKALDTYRRALPLGEKSGDKGIFTSILYSLAHTKLELGAPENALPIIQQSLKIIEDLRANVASPEFRASYFSGVRQHYELCIRILMQLETLHPRHGFAAEALLVSEKARMRLLLDLVTESRTSMHDMAETNLMERERVLRGLFRSQAQFQMDLSLNGKHSTDLAAAENNVAQLRADYEEVQGQLREHKRRLSSFEAPYPVSLEQIRSELRDNDTILLEYALGEDQSYLWAVTLDSFQSFELPSRKIIEDAAIEFYKLITARQTLQPQSDVAYQANLERADKLLDEKAGNLGQMLLGPLAHQLGNRRLIVVSEGALQYIPFEAFRLPLAPTSGETWSPTKPGNLLIESNEVVVLPSISTLIAIRGQRNRPNSTSKLVAVIADPVFSKSDDRVNRGGPAVAFKETDEHRDRSMPSIEEAQTRDGSLGRLPYAKEEAEAISSFAPWGTTMVARGFDATREIAMSSDVGQYQIVHFATHGFLDSEHPELSGIVLSMVDQDGVPADGLMPLHDIYNLNLSAELTVLSACQTALGKDIKGEGLIGLTHSFLSAGSKSVVSSLWKVDDKATAVLMADFYQAMLQTGTPPSTALRVAKLKMMRDQRWNAPYYWAGFILQGDYNNRLCIDRNPWLRRSLVLLSLLMLTIAAPIVVRKWKRRVC